ncbi:MAG: hypothetical protein B6242_04870 [Anaerolineaceae bacterium 4572_78]|nr:MAG: hypothetical protein B6242_04870 [Anaerolineaceae bacterium 4572_78]
MGQKAIRENTLFYGDNLTVMQEYIADESVDLIYLDPPFNSNRNYNVLYKDESGLDSTAQIIAFEDTWHWSFETEDEFQAMVRYDDELGQQLQTFVNTMGRNQMTAYLVMMSNRLLELHRILKPTGSLYLHCDPTASHYLKIILDMIFGAKHFLNEIVWCYSHGGKGKTRYARKHDVILFFSKGKTWTFNGDSIGIPRDTGVKSRGGKLGIDEDGRPYQDKIVKKTGKVYRYYLDKGKIPEDWWVDINSLQASVAERLGYPTQKPLALLERIIKASSNEGDVVMDPFCGCGTAVHAAQSLGRTWIGIDITYLAIALIKNRLHGAFEIEAGKDYNLIGEPTTMQEAKYLAKQDRYQFQWWALGLLPARPYGAKCKSKHGKKGKDTGIDGIMTFSEGKGKDKQIIVQVKSGKVSSRDIRDLHGTVEREKHAVMGVFVTLHSATHDMNLESMAIGKYHWHAFDRYYPKIQILTIEDLLHGETVKKPGVLTTLKQAERELIPEAMQEELL